MTGEWGSGPPGGVRPAERSPEAGRAPREACGLLVFVALQAAQAGLHYCCYLLLLVDRRPAWWAMLRGLGR